jgi:hypothetical protein
VNLKAIRRLWHYLQSARVRHNMRDDTVKPQRNMPIPFNLSHRVFLRVDMQQ